MQFLVPHKMSFGDNSKVVNAPVVTSEPTDEVFRKNNCNKNNILASSLSQEENLGENNNKNDKLSSSRQRQGSPLSNLNEKKI